MNSKTWFILLMFIQTMVVNGTFFKGSTSIKQVSPLIFLSRAWYFLILLMNVPVYGMELLWDDGMAHRSMYGGFTVEHRIPGYEDYKKEIENRINQGLKGADLIKPYYIKPYYNDSWDLFKRCVFEAYPDLLQQLVGYDPSIKNSDEFHGALSMSVWKKNLELTKWFIVNGANVDFKGGDALREAASRNIQSIVILFLMHNANPNLQDFFGATCLHDMSSNYLGYFSTEQDQCDMAQLLIVGGTDCSLKAYNNGGAESKHNEKTAVEIACIEQKFKLASIIERTALQRDSLFAAVAKGKVIPFRSTNDKERESWTSRYHARTIHGDSLLHCAFAYNNLPVAQKLIYLWPQLLTQPNFKGETVLDLFPQGCIELLQFNSVL